jgi:hypothetical protein
MNFTPFIAAWVFLGLGTLVLAAYRKFLSTYEDDNLHIANEELGAKQFASARRFATIDRWGEALTVLLVATGVILGGIYLYLGWMRG